MFARKTRAYWPRMRGSLRLMLGAQPETTLAVKLADGPVCRQPRILRKTAVFVGTSTLIFASAAWVTNLNEARWWEKALNDQLDVNGPRLCGSVTSIDESCPTRLRISAWLDTLQGWHDAHMSHLPRRFYPVARRFFDDVWTFALQSDSYRVFKVFTAVNVGIFLAWRLPRCWRFLEKHTLHHGLSGRSYTMFLTGFSHMSLPHLAVNSFLFYFLVGGLSHIARMDGAYPAWTYAMPQLAAFWIVSGAFAIFFPEVISLIAFRKAIAALPPGTTLMAHTLQPWHPVPLLINHGASSVVYALGAVMVCREDEYGPFVTILGYDIRSIQLGMAWVVAEATVHLFAWTSAPVHLSGALFGVIYYRWGSRYWQWMRDHVGNRTTRYEVDEHGQRTRACAIAIRSDIRRC